MEKIIAIDGPSGSGKSSMAQRLAQNIGALFIDTGAMFRAIGLRAHQLNVPFEEGDAIKDFLNNLNFEYAPEQGVLIKVDGEDLTTAIREHKVSELASIISQIPSVRLFLLKVQRSLVEKHICVMEGRDIGTVVFPNAFCKVFLTASPKVRAQRRFDQIREKDPGSKITLEDIVKDVEERDRKDTTREHAPLKQAEDATFLDSGSMTPDEVVANLENIVKKKAMEHSISL